MLYFKKTFLGNEIKITHELIMQRHDFNVYVLIYNTIIFEKLSYLHRYLLT